MDDFMEEEDCLDNEDDEFLEEDFLEEEDDEGEEEEEEEEEGLEEEALDDDLAEEDLLVSTLSWPVLKPVLPKSFIQVSLSETMTLLCRNPLPS